MRSCLSRCVFVSNLKEKKKSLERKYIVHQSSSPKQSTIHEDIRDDDDAKARHLTHLARERYIFTVLICFPFSFLMVFPSRTQSSHVSK